MASAARSWLRLTQGLGGAAASAAALSGGRGHQPDTAGASRRDKVQLAWSLPHALACARSHCFCEPGPQPRPQSAGAPAAGSCITDWGNQKKAADLELSYQKRDVVRSRAEMVEMLRPMPGERILDVGCGPGFLVKDLAAAVGDAGHVEGLDPSSAMCSMAEARLQGMRNTSVRTGSAEALPYPDGYFDAVVFSQVLLYVPDVSLALAEAHRVLRTGGRIMICDTDWNSLIVNTLDKERFQRIFAACTSTFVHPHLPPKLPGMLTKAGVPVSEARTVAMVTAGRSTDSFMTKWAFSVVPDKARAFGLPESDVEAWLREQRALDEAGAFFACVHRFLFLAQKKP